MPRLRPLRAQVGSSPSDARAQHETLYWVRDILERGADWFANQGRRDARPALSPFPDASSTRRPPRAAGSPARELIAEYCGGMLPGHEFYAYLPGGAVGGILPASFGRRSAGLRYAAAAWLLYRLGGGDHSLQHDRARDARST